jgi:hypothetical protein
MTEPKLCQYNKISYRCYDFKNIFAEKLGTYNSKNIAKNGLLYMYFKKNDNSFAEN